MSHIKCKQNLELRKNYETYLRFNE